MAFKIVDASELRVGSNMLIDGESCTVKKMDISKTGKHGHAKCRIEAVGIISGKKKVLVVPGHDKFEVPLIEKKKAQVLSIIDEKASIMDAESFENFEIAIPEELKGQVQEGMNVEYWDIEGDKIIKRTL